ncbi:MAG: chorismate mutase [Nitrospinota bacterium]
MMDGLAALRRRIEECDAQIVHWINERLKTCQEVGRFKHERGMEVRAPEREREVVAKAHRLNQGPCPAEVLEQVFRLLIDVAVALEEQEQTSRRGRSA